MSEERTAITAEIAEIERRLGLYARARDVVAGRIAKIQAEDLAPIASEIATMEAARTAVQDKLDVLNFQAAEPPNLPRHLLLDQTGARATAAYRRIQVSQTLHPEVKANADRLFAAARDGHANSKMTAGSTDTWEGAARHLQADAGAYKAFLALAVSLEELAA